MRLYRFYESLALLAAFWRRRGISLSCSAPGSLPMQLLEFVMIDTFWTLQSGAILAAHSSNRRKNMRNIKTLGGALAISIAAAFVPHWSATAQEETCRLCEPASNGRIGTVRDFLSSNTDPDFINAQDSKGRTPLFLAVRGNHALIVENLLSADPAADADIRNNAGRSPLMWAAEHRSFRMIGNLINQGNADLNFARTRDSYVALDFLFKDLPTPGNADNLVYNSFKLLADNGAEISNMVHESKDLFAALHQIQEDHPSISERRFDSFFKKLVEAAGDISDLTTADQQTGLIHAASYGFLDLTRALIEHGVACDEPDADGEFPVDHADGTHHYAVGDYLERQDCPGRDICDPDEIRVEGECVACESNEKVVGGTSCVECGATEMPNNNRDACIPCQANAIGNDDGECVCQSGYIEDTEDATMCVRNCNNGYSPVGDRCIQNPVIWTAYLANDLELVKAVIADPRYDVNEAYTNNPYAKILNYAVANMDISPNPDVREDIAEVLAAAGADLGRYPTANGNSVGFGYTHILHWLNGIGSPSYTRDTFRVASLRFMKHLFANHTLDVDVDTWGTPLYWAVRRNWTNHALFLISQGADCYAYSSILAWSRIRNDQAIIDACSLQSASGASGASGVSGAEYEDLPPVEDPSFIYDSIE